MFDYHCSDSSVLKVGVLDNVIAGRQLFPLRYSGYGKPRCHRCSETMTSRYEQGCVNLDVLQPMYINVVEHEP